MKTKTNTTEVLDQYQPHFGNKFEDAIMSKIANIGEAGYNLAFNRAFQRIALSGVAAVGLLLLSIYLTDGAFSPDSLIGTNNLDFESISALTISGY